MADTTPLDGIITRRNNDDFFFSFKHLFFHVGSIEIRQAGPGLSAHLMSLVCFGICCSLQASHHVSTHESLEMKMKAAARSVDAHTGFDLPKICLCSETAHFKFISSGSKDRRRRDQQTGLHFPFNFPNFGFFFAE